MSSSYPVPGGYTLRVLDDDDIDTLYSPEAITALTKSGLRMLVNPSDRARRTLTVHGVDSVTQGTFKDKFTNKYPKDKILSLHTEPIKGTVKLVFTSIKSVEKFHKEGIKFEDKKFPPYALNIDKYLHIPECQSCYRLFPDHKTKRCPDKHIKLCSKCGNSAHRWNECTYALPPKCILCTRAGRDAGHPTRTLSCPERKAALKSIRYGRNQTRTENIHPPNTIPVSKQNHKVNQRTIITNTPTDCIESHQSPPEPPAPSPPSPPAPPPMCPVAPAGRLAVLGGADSDLSGENPTDEEQEVGLDTAHLLAGMVKGFPAMSKIGEFIVPGLISDALTPLLYGMLADIKNPGTFAEAANALQISVGIKPTKFPDFNYLAERKTPNANPPTKKKKPNRRKKPKHATQQIQPLSKETGSPESDLSGTEDPENVAYISEDPNSPTETVLGEAEDPEGEIPAEDPSCPEPPEVPRAETPGRPETFQAVPDEAADPEDDTVNLEGITSTTKDANNQPTLESNTTSEVNSPALIRFLKLKEKLNKALQTPVANTDEEAGVIRENDCSPAPPIDTQAISTHRSETEVEAGETDSPTNSVASHSQDGTESEWETDDEKQTEVKAKAPKTKKKQRQDDNSFLKQVPALRPLLRDPRNPRTVAALHPMLHDAAKRMVQGLDESQAQQLSKFFVQPSTGEKATLNTPENTPELKTPKHKRGKEYPKGYFLRK